MSDPEPPDSEPSIWEDESADGGEPNRRGPRGPRFVLRRPLPVRNAFVLYVLGGIASAFIFTALCYLCLVTQKYAKEAAVFGEIMKTILPSLATLVLGYIIHDKGKA